MHTKCPQRTAVNRTRSVSGLTGLFSFHKRPTINLIVYPVKDLAKTKKIYTTWLGIEPYIDQPYYVGFRIGDQEIGLDPNAKTSGPIGYVRVDDIQKSLQSLLDSGVQKQQEVKDIGGGKLIAIVQDTNGNVIGLVQEPKPGS